FFYSNHLVKTFFVFFVASFIYLFTNSVIFFWLLPLKKMSIFIYFFAASFLFFNHLVNFFYFYFIFFFLLLYLFIYLPIVGIFFFHCFNFFFLTERNHLVSFF
ncbi:hypothetical protein I3842_01G076600, partial [Carya illinoinensis]